MPPLQYFPGIPLVLFFNENSGKTFRVTNSNPATTGLNVGDTLVCKGFDMLAKSLIFKDQNDTTHKIPIIFFMSTSGEGNPPELPLEIELQIPGGRRRRTKRRRTKRRRTRRRRSYRK
jgi:hypothetical protein